MKFGLFKNVMFGACFATVLVNQALAGEGIDKCNDILQQDLNNHIEKRTEQAQNAQQTNTQSFFTAGEDDAFDAYKKAFAERKTEGDKGHLEGHYGFAGGAGDFAHSYDHELNKEEFHKEWSHHQSVYQTMTASSSSSSAHLIEIFQSNMHDQGTVEAWKQCMKTRSQEANFFAYGYRDKSGAPYINVFWAPGDLVGFATSVHFWFPQQKEFTIEGASQDNEIGMGSGMDFPISFKDSKDSRAKTDGFAVLVNAKATKDTQLIHNFQATATVPPFMSPQHQKMVEDFTRHSVPPDLAEKLADMADRGGPKTVEDLIRLGISREHAESMLLAQGIGVGARTQILVNAAQPELTPVPNFFVKKGQRLIIVTPQNTRAQWRIASPSAPRGGMTGPGGLREVVNGFHRGALVAQIGNGPVFAVGVRYFGTANEDGQLKLGCWDDNYQDHEGTIPVDVVRGD